MPTVTVYGRLFEATDLCQVIQDSRTSVLNDCDGDLIEKVASNLDKALVRSLAGFSRKSSPAERRKWARRVERDAQALLHLFGMPLNDVGAIPQWVTYVLGDALPGDGSSFRLRTRSASEQAFGVPDPGDKQVEQAINGLRFLGLLAGNVRGLNAQRGSRRPDEHILLLIEKITDAYNTITRKDSTRFTKNVRNFLTSTLRVMSDRIVERKAKWRVTPSTIEAGDLAKKLRALIFSEDALRDRFKDVRRRRRAN